MGFFLILAILALGLLARSQLVVMAAAILLVLKLLNIQKLFDLLASKGINAGLLLLVLTVLLPVATDQVSARDILKTFLSPLGVVALVSGLLATKMNGMGLELLKVEPQMIIGMVIGSVVGIVFWGGIPVGPLMAGGLAAILVKIFGLL